MKITADNRFFSFMSKVGDCIALNLLFLATCIPIVTIGPSACALYCALKKRLRDEECYITRDYFSAWKENFHNGICISLFYIACTILLYFFSRYFTDHLTNLIVVALYFLYLFWYCFSLIYVFPLQATFVNTPGKIIYNSFLTALSHFPQSLALFAVTFFPAVFTWLFPQYLYFTLAYWLLLGCSLACIGSLYITKHVFRAYMK